MYYEHDRRWFTTGNNIANLFQLLKSELGDFISEERTEVVFLETGIRHLRIERNGGVENYLNIKNRVLPEAFIESMYSADSSIYLDNLSKSKLLPYLNKKRYTWEINEEGRMLNVYLDIYGESDFCRVKLVERNREREFSEFVRNYKAVSPYLTDVSYNDQFSDPEIAWLLYANNQDYSKVESILVMHT